MGILTPKLTFVNSLHESFQYSYVNKYLQNFFSIKTLVGDN